MEYNENRLIDGCSEDLTEQKKSCTIPFNEEDAFHSFQKIGDTIESLSYFASKTSHSKHQNTFVHAMRNLKSVFDPAYDKENNKEYRLPIHNEILTNIAWYEGADFSSKTITVEKTNDELRLVYEDGFHATDECVYVDAFKQNKYLKERIKNCGKGVQDHHCPYMPELGEQWRRTTPSKFKFSIEKTGNGIRLGIENNPPKEPKVWYWYYKHLTQIAGPYANITFSIENQTSTVQYMVEEYIE